MELPMKKVKASTKNPRKLIIFGKPKVGKTSIFSQLPNSLILDLEGGTDLIDSCKVSIKNIDDLRDAITSIKEAGNPYKYIIVDTVSKLEDIVLPVALAMYKKTPQGKNFKDKDVRNLGKGYGYRYTREALDTVLEQIYSLSEYTILSGHIKNVFFEKDGKEWEASEIDLTGKSKNDVCADADAIGYIYRKDGKAYLNFEPSDNIICGSRASHLEGKEIVISEKEDGRLITRWDKIYI